MTIRMDSFRMDARLVGDTDPVPPDVQGRGSLSVTGR